MSALLVIVFAAAAVVLVRAAVVLVGTADEMAEITGLGRVLIGTMVLAGATSLPQPAEQRVPWLLACSCLVRHHFASVRGVPSQGTSARSTASTSRLSSYGFTT